MIIDEFIAYSGNPPPIENLCPEGCSDPCSNIYEPLRVNLSASHGCNDAEFDCYIRLYQESIKRNKDVWLYITRLNLNTTDHNRPDGDNPALAQFDLTADIVETANQGKENDRQLCCSLPLKLIACHFPGSEPYFENGSVSLPLENSTDLYLPPLDSPNGIGLQNRNKTRIHTNIINTTVTRLSDGQILIPGTIWYGGIELDLCKALTDPGKGGPWVPVL